MTSSTTITLDHIRAWSSRSKLIESDLEEASKETRIRWANLMRLLVTKRAERHEATDGIKELAPDLILSEREKTAVVDSLSRHFAKEWRIHSPAVWRAIRTLRKEHGNTVQAAKRRVLQSAIIEALHDADEERITRIGDDRIWTQGNRLILLQKKDLQQSAKRGTAGELIRKLTAQPAGLRGSPSWRAHEPLGPIEAAFRLAELETEQVRPVELRPTLLLKWVRRRAFMHATKSLLEQAGLDASDAPRSYSKVRIRIGEGRGDHEPDSKEGLNEIELLEALGQDEPHPLDPLVAVEQREGVQRIGTPRQVEYFEAVSKKMSEGLDERDALEAVAEAKGVKPNTVRKNLHRLRDRVAEFLAEE